VRRIEADGRVRLIAGGGSSVDPEETDARATCFSGFTGLAVGDDGTVYVGESGTTGCGLRGPGVRAVYPDGTMSLFLGGVRAAPSGSRPADGAAAATLLNGLGELTMRRNGKLLVVHRGPTTTRHEVSLPTLNASRLVPSPDGEEVYAFDARGRHLRTVSARTGLLLWQFTWGPNGLASITDVNGDVTTVEREASGAVRALVAQDGQRTELTLDAQGRVTRITDQEGRFVEAAYRSDTDGLLQEWKDEDEHPTVFEWDANGNLLTHTNARNAKKRFAKTSVGVDFTSGEQRLTQYLQQRRDSPVRNQRPISLRWGSADGRKWVVGCMSRGPSEPELMGTRSSRRRYPAAGFRFSVHFNTGGVIIVVTITITTTAEKICGSTTRSPFTIS
jgi:YD repeat-containing protein